MHCPKCKRDTSKSDNLTDEIFDKWPLPITKIYSCKYCNIQLHSEVVRYRDEKEKPILLLDFDGVIHSYESGWQGIDVIPDLPIDGAFDAIRSYLKYFKVHIYSSRSKTEDGIHAMIEWFIYHCFEEIDQLTFSIEKPAAFLTIDDRAIQFKGNFPQAGELLSFKPWYKEDGRKVEDNL